jgi:hypothetical protein
LTIGISERVGRDELIDETNLESGDDLRFVVEEGTFVLL